jgi:hypothetical protein
VSTDDIEGVARRLSVEPMAGKRTLPDGSEVSWRMLGVEAAFSERVPFFLQWDDDAPHPGDSGGAHGAITWLELGGDPDHIQEWLGEDVPGLRLVGGDPGIRAMGIAGALGELRLPERPWGSP